MKNYKTEDLIKKNLLLLVPLIIYAVYKNGYLLYDKRLINFFSIFKSIYLILISILIKIIIDFIKDKKIKIDYNIIYVILIAMAMPCNINYFIYISSFAILYILSNFLEKRFKFNKVCFIYLVVILINFLFQDYTFKSLLELNYDFSYNFLDLLIGRNIGGICTTSILFSLVAYVIFINDFYYKKDIPLIINITYLILSTIYYVLTSNNSLLLNSELIFSSIFVCSLPEYSPFEIKHQYIYSILIGMLTFVFGLLINPIFSVYLATFIVSLTLNINLRQKKLKCTLE